MKLFDGHQYIVSHNPCASPLLGLHTVYGGNPREIDLFTPIIIGHHKTQQILSKHFNYVTTCFANDLSDCDTFLSIGSSFSDSHLNALIRQYTFHRHVNYRIVTIEKDVDSIENNVSFDIIGYSPSYTPNDSLNKVFERENGRLVYYKRGTKSFLEDDAFWRDYL